MVINEEKLIRFTQKLIQTPSPSGNEQKIANVIAEEMKTLGYKEVVVDEKNNVIGIIRGEKPGTNIMFNGHIDHADVGSMVNPYSGEIIDGEKFGTKGPVIFGRGACDMKAAVAAMVYAGAELQKNASKLGGDVYITAVALEEQARGEGVLHLLNNSDYKFDVAVSGEATDMQIHLGHRGKLEYLIKVIGETCHSSNPSRGINAIFNMNKMLSIIENEYANSLGEHDFLGKATVTVIDILSKPGRLTPVVPDYCEIVMDRRYLPHEGKDKVEKEIQDMFCMINNNFNNFKADFEFLKDFPVLYCPPEEPIVIAAKNAAAKVSGKDPKLKSWKFGVDGAFISQRDIPCVGFGPGSEYYAHTPEDHVHIKDIISSAEVYYNIPFILAGS